MTYLNILLLNLLQESSIIRVLILLIVLKEMRKATQQPGFIIKAVININWEYWVDFTRKGQVPAKMPYNYVLEMFCDRVAASKIYEGKNYIDAFPLQYYESGHIHIYYILETRALFVYMLVYLKDHGLDDTIKMINRHHDYDEYFVEFKDDFM